LNRVIIVAIFILAFCTTVHAQSDSISYTEFQQKAAEAYRDHDYSLFVRYTARAIDINPHSPVNWYNLACGYALTGQKEGALRILMELAAEGVDFGAANDPDLESVRNTEEFRQAQELLDSRTFPISTSSVYFTMDRIDFLPEGIAYDSVSERFFLGSRSYGTIVAVDHNKREHEFAQLETDRLYSCLGLEVDRTRNVLWAVGSVLQPIKDFDVGDEGRTGIFGFDLDSGERKYLFMLPEIRSRFGFNDLTVSSGGDIYITGDALYRIQAGDSLPEILIPAGDVIGPNGITFADSEETLYVADFAKGILKYDIPSGDWHWLRFPDTITVAGFDGLYYFEKSLVGIQPTIRPWRVMQLYLDDSGSAITDYRTIERANPSLSEATTGVIIHGEFYYVATGKPPEDIPGDIPESWKRNLGKTIIMRAALR